MEKERDGKQMEKTDIWENSQNEVKEKLQRERKWERERKMENKSEAERGKTRKNGAQDTKIDWDRGGHGVGCVSRFIHT